MTSNTINTRKKTEIWLIGYTRSTLLPSKLPSVKEVMSLFFYYKNVMNNANKESASRTVNDVLALWQKASIPTKDKQHVISKILKYFKEWQNLKKNKENKTKRSAAIKAKELKWQSNLDVLFDIAHSNALNMITIEEDKQFLLNQRKMGRQGRIGNTDRMYAKKFYQKSQTEAKYERIKEKEKEAMKRLTEKCVLLSSSTSSSEKGSSDVSSPSTPTPQPGPSTSKDISSPPRKRGRKSILDDNLATSLDVAKLSDRKATIVLASTIKSLGCDVSQYNVSFSSIRRHRMNIRQQLAESLKDAFQPQTTLTIHWDGKMLEDITGHETVDRLPILVSGKGVDQLLAVAKLPDGKGETMASAIFESILSWRLSEKIKCMCFDTTASNTGRINGACILLEQKMEKELIWLACRHHILEIVLEAVVVSAMGPSSGPEILIFKRFKNYWPKIKQRDFQTAVSEQSTWSCIENIAADMIAFANNQLQKFQPRDDYKELLHLIIIFLGGIPDKGISFKAPAGIHRARWMAKAIYALKMYLFKHQLKITVKETKALTNICIFVVRVYAKYWFTAPVSCMAPANDLQMLKDLVLFEKYNQTLAKVAIKKMLGHLWYLSEELIAFAFFDDRISFETKRKMILALDKEGLESRPKRITLEFEAIENKNIEDFVSKNTRKFFELTGVSSEFLQKDPELWEEEESYKSAKEIVENMRIVNDLAERGVALMEEYNKLHTNNEEQKQYLMLLVKDYRQKNPNVNKANFM